MRISIVLPRASSEPIGGYLVQYELADQLAAKGHDVTVVHASTVAGPWRAPKPFGLDAFRASRRPQVLVPWHPFHPRVRLRLVPWLTRSFLPRADITILTAFQTAQRVAQASRRTGPLVQIVYDYEFWAGGSPAGRLQIERALRRPDIAHIATSQAVRSMLDTIGVPTVRTVPPGIATGSFVCRARPSDRLPTIGFSYRPEPHKGMGDLLDALQHVHELYPDVAVQCFRAAGDVALPAWVERLDYLTKDQLVAFYNRCSVFVLPSHYEGWGLPAAEAMACGAAVVTTDSGGPRDFAENETTALVVPPGDVRALTAAMVRLLEDDQLRFQLADTGVRRLSAMTWEKAAESIEAVLNQLVPDYRSVGANYELGSQVDP